MSKDGKIETVLKIAKDLVLNAKREISRKDLIALVLKDPRIQEMKIQSGTVHTQAGQVDQKFPDQIVKVGRGVLAARTLGPVETRATTSKTPRLNESSLYEPLVDFLTQIGECTVAADTSTMRGNGKWGNPDVVGMNKPKAVHAVKFWPQLVVCEVKPEPKELVTAYGQCACYQLFAHKVYIVLPSEIEESELDRIKALCQSSGVGIIIFDAAQDDTFDFELRLLAQVKNPDLFYTNEFADRLREYDPDAFNVVFS